MRKSPKISLKECYAILQLSKDATLEDVKKSYRKRAFELHPDLNPDDPTASKQFQLLNEAYVALSQIMQKEEEARQAKEKAQAQARAQAAAQASAQAGKSTYSKPHTAQKESQKAKETFKQERAHSSQDGARREEEARKRQEARKAEEIRKAAEARKAAEERKAQEERKAEQVRKAEQARKAEAERQKREAREKEEAKKEEARIKEDIRKRTEESRQRAASAAYGKEDVLRDLLHDPFARRVFEDIYSEVSKQSSENPRKPTTEETHAENEQHAGTRAASGENTTQSHWSEQIRPKAKSEENTKTTPPPPPPTAEVDLGDSKANLHLENSFSGKIFGWFRQQIDDEQTIRMPASHLFKGARIRLQIRRGLSEDLSTVEIVLPQDFVVGKPIRLRGLGKKVGKWQGDLYLTIESK